MAHIGLTIDEKTWDLFKSVAKRNHLSAAAAIKRFIEGVAVSGMLPGIQDVGKQQSEEKAASQTLHLPLNPVVNDALIRKPPKPEIGFDSQGRVCLVLSGDYKVEDLEPLIRAHH